VKNQVFGSVYAEEYDLFYKDKDYEAECDMIEEIFQRYADGQVSTILDLGCGTGNHAIPLAHRGYKVTGVDRSPEMLEHAKVKLQSQTSSPQSHPQFLEGDVRSLKLNQQFDVVLMMFAVLGYQITNEDILAALRTVRRHLRPGGLFLCDVWYGPAVLSIRPGDRIKIIPTSNGKVIRAASGSLDVYHHTADVCYKTWSIKGQQVVSETEETHRMRYFFPQELDLFFTQADMKLLEMSDFNDSEKPATEETWNCLAVGQAEGVKQ
jgi:ubiquinone/menaquinone biosynthesis C-methylase UbiE